MLGTLVPLALLVSRFTASGRTELLVASGLRASAATRAAADGAIHEAVLRLLQGRWTAGGPDREVRAGQVIVRVTLEDLALRTNPNLTSVAGMAGVLTRAGVDASKALPLARAIVDWRSNSAASLSGGSKLDQYRMAGIRYAPTNRAFESVDEMSLVLGMTPEILIRLRPLLSVYGIPDATPLTADPAGGANLADPDPQPPPAAAASVQSDPDRVVLVTATATIGRARFTRQAVVRLHGSPKPRQLPFQVLTWEAPPG